MLAAYILNLGAEVWGKKWRAAVLWSLKSGGEKRFSEIKREMDNCSVKVLTEVLRDLEKNRLIVRKQYPSIPVKVTYTLDPAYFALVNSLEEYVNEMCKFFHQHKDYYNLPEEIVTLLDKRQGTK